MSSDIDSSSQPGSQDPYAQLGLEPGASFDAVQMARSKRLSEVGDDLQARAKIEASYDAVLMASLKERQLGKVSNAAENASNREEGNLVAGGGKAVGSSLLTRLRSLNPSSSSSPVNNLWPELSLPNGQGLIIRLVLGFLAVVLVLASPSESIELILSLSTIGLFISQVRRGRRILPSIGWSVVLLSIGLIIGGILVGLNSSQDPLNMILSGDKLEALPAIVIIWAAALFLA